ncbi:hypothetical protein SLS60_004474 [Paraconiothyrium brasiliense]|uniref:F-box domain-containing protein n=1 Tax=Paraconiothyrium brasiliense TaxID=300254 RepID=A0ABR3RL80_9PLEO
MCLFNDLPNELLCQVAEFLPTGAVHALALTSRKLKRVSYPVLYKKISLPIPIEKPKQEDHRILLFARTLTARPDFADGITGLDVSVRTDHPDMISTDINIGAMRALGASIIETIPDTLPLGSQRNNKAWLQRLFDLDNLAWLGLLLYMLPSLETLYARFLGRTLEGKHYIGSGALENLFVAPKMDFSLVPGLCGLKELGLQCRKASGEWCYLPKLERMWLDQKVKFVQHNQSRPSLSVTELSMVLSTEVLSPRVTNQILGFSGFWKPSPFAVLRRLNIDLDNVLRFLGTMKPADIIREGHYTQGAARMLSAQLKPLAHTLEELHLTVANGTDSQFLDHVGPFPVGTLTTFRKLKVLWLPQALLLPRDLIPRPELIQDNEPLTVDDTFFPTTLRSLRFSTRPRRFIAG